MYLCLVGRRNPSESTLQIDTPYDRIILLEIVFLVVIAYLVYHQHHAPERLVLAH